MRTLSTIANSAPVRAALFFAIAICIAFPHAEECTTGKGLTSNDIVWLSGYGDTLWMVTQRSGGLALNKLAGADAIARPTEDSAWWSYTLGCKNGIINDLASGGGLTIMSLDSAPNILWTYNHATKRIRELSLPWPPDTSRTFTINEAVYAGGSFYCACLDGGLVGWDINGDKKTVFIPGRSSKTDLPALTTGSLPTPSPANRVTRVEIAKPDSLLIVVTPARLWRFSLVDSSWDSSIAPIGTDPDLRDKQFDYVFVNTLDRTHPVYAIVGDTGDGNESDPVLRKYSRTSKRWETVFEQAPKAMSFAPGGYYYALFDEPGTNLRNIIRVYRDTLGDSGTVQRGDPVVREERIHARMTRAHNIDVPAVLNDVIFVPRSDTSGYLWIATSEGLFFSRNETPGKVANDTTSFILIKRAPALASGLKKTYARPGIITPSSDGCTFIYNVSKTNTRVTIRVYDYNMDLVKVVIDNKIRQPGSQGGPLGRSTVESEDNWNATTARGKPVAPGVYYYKITTSTGERSFGKIVVAR